MQLFAYEVMQKSGSVRVTSELRSGGLQKRMGVQEVCDGVKWVCNYHAC